MSRIFHVMLICMRSHSHCVRDDRFLSDYYSKLKQTLHKLDFYQSLVLDLKVL